jgi:hypothetical protein
VYDMKTRSMIQNAANKSALTSRDSLKGNSDGSVDLWFGPEAPKGFESNWVDTASVQRVLPLVSVLLTDSSVL